MVVEVIGLAEDIAEVVVVEVELVVQAGPVDVLDLSRDQAEDNNHDDQDHSSGADARGAIAFALRPLVLDQFDYAPNDEQRRPVIGEQMGQAADGQNSHGGHQEDRAEHDQNEGSGKGSVPPRWRRNNRWNRRRSIRWNTGRRDRRPQANVSVVGGIALHQLDYSNHQQYGGPRSAKADAGNAVEQEKYAQGNQHCQPHDLAGAAVFALAPDRTAADQAPLFGEEPHPEKDQDEWPKAVQSELEQAGGMQQKDYAQSDENGRSGGNLGAFEFLAGAEGLCQAEWIRSRFAQLDRLGAAHRVNDLVDVEKANGNP